MKLWGIAIGLAALAVGACASVGNDVLRTQDAKGVDQAIIDGKTTRSQVEAMYGPPNATSYASAQSEIWVYRWARSTSRPENFIPYVGILVAGNDVQKKELVILFNEQNIVTRHSMRETNETVRRNLLSSSSSTSGVAQPPPATPPSNTPASGAPTDASVTTPAPSNDAGSTGQPVPVAPGSGMSRSRL
jgi:hypothetical protein